MGWQNFSVASPGYGSTMNMSGMGLNPSMNTGSMPLFRNPDDTIIQVGGRGMYRGPHDRRDSFKDKYKGRPNPFQNTLVISSIPPELNSIDKLNSHFKQFGTIVNIQV